MKRTDPVAPAGVTCAINVTVCPYSGAIGETLVKVAVVGTAAALTVPANRNNPHNAAISLGNNGTPQFEMRQFAQCDFFHRYPRGFRLCREAAVQAGARKGLNL